MARAFTKGRSQRPKDMDQKPRAIAVVPMAKANSHRQGRKQIDQRATAEFPRAKLPEAKVLFAKITMNK